MQGPFGANSNKKDSDKRSLITHMANYLGSLEVGAFRPFGGRAAAPRGFHAAPKVDRSRLVPKNPGMGQSGQLMLKPLGLGSVTFTATSGTLLSLSGQPQKAFLPKRLILDVSRTGTSATGLVTVNRIDIGADSMQVSAGGVGGLPAAMFANVGVDLNIEFAPATPGILINVQLNISAAPTMTDTVVVSGGMLGTSY